MLKPLQGRVIIKMIDVEETTESGIILGGASKESTKIAEVIAVGNEKNNNEDYEKINLKKGDKVVANKYTGSEIKYKGENLIILKQEDILAIIE